MFEAWGRALYRRRRLTLGLTLVLVAFAVPAHLLGRHGRQDAARRLDGQAGVADAGQ